jgi:hypothetical protein
MLLSSHRLLKILEYMAFFSVLFALARPRWASGFFSAIERRFRDLARHRYKSLLAAALFPMMVRALMLPWYPPPPPQIHDEFSYLLQGDTFAHGRIANPTPPYWQHFESEYILLQPVYASQYQPAQGIVLAAGEIVFHNAWFGVWFGTGLMCASLCWALRGILPARWALFGAIAAALQFGIFGLWMNSYFGGAVAASAGALVLGSLARMQKPGNARSMSALCALGIVLLMASRPFEGILWAGVALAWILSRVLRKPVRPRLAQILVPGSLVLLAGAGGLAYYNWRITGHPTYPPYLAYQRIYGTPQPFWWQPPVEVKDFDFPELRDNYLNQLHLYQNRYSLTAIVQSEGKRLRDFWRFFIGPFFTLPLLFIPFLFRDRRIRPWLWASIPFILDKATYHAWFPAQNAPATVLIVLVVVECWRHMLAFRPVRVPWPRRTLGLAISRQLIAACVLAIVLGGLGRAVEPVLPRQLQHLPPIWESLYPARRLRDDVTARLEKIPGKHLVFVKYGPNHCFCEEWVFNGADLQSQKIVYARPYTPATDRGLAQYLEDHDVWLIEPDERPYKLERVDDSLAARMAKREAMARPPSD